MHINSGRSKRSVYRRVELFSSNKNYFVFCPDQDYEFCVYHNQNDRILRVNEGQLLLKPIILEDSYGENATAYGRLQLHE